MMMTVHGMETQMSSYLEQAQMKHVMNEAKQQNKIEKNEAERQKWLKIKKKPKRRRVLVKIEKDGKPIIQQSEGTLQISIDRDTEEADEKFAQSVAEEIKTLTIDEFQMAPRQIGIKIWQYPWLCCANWFAHRKLMNEYLNVCFLD
uniref:Uncharacterized protein n=1 Tax=Wuchereria bancrofti TaxID=6293 RepID=A0AAF5PJT2_WUCBA